jgi:hypothetical protein
MYSALLDASGLKISSALYIYLTFTLYSINGNPSSKNPLLKNTASFNIFTHVRTVHYTHVNMIWNAASVLCFGTFAAAAVLERRQGVIGIGPNGKKQTFGYNFDLERVGPAMNPVSVVDAKVQYRQNSQRKLVRFGPFVLPPAKVSLDLDHLSHSIKAQ